MSLHRDLTSSEYSYQRQSINQRPISSSSIKSCITNAQSTSDPKLKFQILETIIDDFSHSSELVEFFTELLSEIFGCGEYSGWRLSTLDSKSHIDEVLYKKVYSFLHPFGHMFKLIKKLDNENAAIDFTTSTLFSTISDPLQSPVLQSFYQRRLGIIPGNQVTTSIKLNALEYYLFMYFYYILQPKVRKGQMDWSRHTDILYVALFEEYLAYFLPADSTQISQSNLQASANSYFSLYDSSLSARSSDPSLMGSQRFQSALQQSSSPFTGMKAIISNTGLNTLRRLTWKSELFVQILVDFWLGQGNELSSTDYTGSLQEYSLPTVDQTLMIRIFIKHMHHFLNSDEKFHSHGSGYSDSTFENQAEEFKRVILPAIVQKRLYLFLKNCFSHWPLDPSFKMVLETWLSYIQPWRYKEINNADGNTSLDQSQLENARTFVGGNILFYTVFLRMFLSRVRRFDLRSVQQVQMIQRVTKVFSQANLAEIIHEAEGDFITSSSPSSIHRISATRLGSSYSNLRPTSKGIDLEEAGFQYEPIFDRSFIIKVEDLAQKLFNESEYLKKESTRNESKPTSKGVIAKLKTFFNAESSDEESRHDAKLVEYLDRICTDLANVFDFAPPKSYKAPFGDADSSSTSQLPKPFAADKCYQDGGLLPEHVIGNDGSVFLTEKGRYQIMQQLRHFKIQGKASIDLEPVKSYEIHCLVRWMYKLSAQLNEKYKVPLTGLYNREDILGKVLRKLSPNVTGQHGLSVRLPVTAPVGSIRPRISLRFLSSYYTIYYIGWLLLISKLFGLGPFELLLFLIVLFALFTLQNMDSYVERKMCSL